MMKIYLDIHLLAGYQIKILFTIGNIILPPYSNICTVQMFLYGDVTLGKAFHKMGLHTSGEMVTYSRILFYVCYYYFFNIRLQKLSFK